MKRHITTVLLVLFCCIAFGQNIRTKFYGEQLGGYRGNALYNLRNNGYEAKVERNVLSAYEVDFAGLKWHFLKMRYFGDRLYIVSYSRYFKNKSLAYECFDGLCERLQNKYDGAFIKEDSNSKALYYFDNSSGLCLDASKSQSKGGDLYWYVELIYWNSALMSKVSNAEDGEL